MIYPNIFFAFFILAISFATNAAPEVKPPTDTGSDFLVLFFFLSVLGYVLLQIYTLAVFKNKWKRLAYFPLFLTVPITGFCVFSLVMNSNVWPLLFIFFAPVAFVYLCALVIVKAFKN